MRDEGDGWVNWSGLATSIAEFAEQFSTSLRRLLVLVSTLGLAKDQISVSTLLK
jgi:hypothetical protein